MSLGRNTPKLNFSLKFSGHLVDNFEKFWDETPIKNLVSQVAAGIPANGRADLLGGYKEREKHTPRSSPVRFSD